MIYWQKITTGLAITVIIGGCSASRSIIVEETLEIDGRARITWNNNQVIDVYMFSAVGDSIVATDLKSRTEIRAHMYQIQSVSTLNRAKGGLWGIATGGAIGAAVGAGIFSISGPGGFFENASDFALVMSIPGAMAGGIIGVIAGKRVTYIFPPFGLPRNSLAASPTDVELPRSMPSAAPPPEPNNHMVGGTY